jgi:hypothetical protein
MSYFNITWVFVTYFLKNTQKSNFMKIHPMGSELFHVDRQTDMTKLVVTFHNFADVPKNLKKKVVGFSVTCVGFCPFRCANSVRLVGGGRCTLLGDIPN